MTLRVPDWAHRGLAPERYDADLEDADREALLQPGQLGSVSLRNRVVLPAMETNLTDVGGRVGERLIAYYRARASGGTALVITENTSVHPSGRVTKQMLRIEDDADGQAFDPLVRAIHDEGARIFVQLSHAGRQTVSDTTGQQPWAPSAIPCPIMKEEPRAIDDGDIATLIAAFAAGAGRAQAAGADGVELHMAHGYLLCGFLSPDQNRRTDRWGGDTAGRCAFPEAVVRAIHDRCGPEFPVQARLSADEFVEGGLDVQECVRIARRLAAAGVQSLSISACNYESMFWNIPTYFQPEGTFLPLIERVRMETGLPVVGVGRLHRPAVAGRAIRQGRLDFVAVGRGQIADPAFVRSLRNPSRPARPCLACNRCIASINGSILECAVNPDIGFEREGPDPRWGGRRVLVVGGGPAGLSAAIAASRAGAAVRLVERRPVLGGQLDLAGLPGSKEPVRWYRRWFLDELQRSDVEVRTGHAATEGDLDGMDVVLWAAGSWPIDRLLEGASTLVRVPLDDAMRQPELAGPRPLVLGGGAGGAEAAHHLAAHGAKVALVESKRRIARDLVPSLRFHLEADLRHEGVRAFTQVTDLAGDGLSVRFQCRAEGAVELADCSALVLAAGRESVPLPPWLLSAGVEVLRLGDADRPASIAEALASAAAIFRKRGVSSAPF